MLKSQLQKSLNSPLCMIHELRPLIDISGVRLSRPATASVAAASFNSFRETPESRRGAPSVYP